MPQPLWRCLKDKSITHSSSKAAATAGFAAGKTETSCAPKAHLRDQRFFSSKAGSNCISFLTRTKANHRPSPRKVTALKRHPNTKHPTAKRAAYSTGRTVSDEIQQLQSTTRHLISPREISSDESRIPQCSISSYGRAIAEIPHQKTC